MGKKKTSVDNLKIVLLGNTGNGKSSAGNTIIGRKVGPFITGASANSVTTISKKYTTMKPIYKKKKITVIDTPDFFEYDDEQKKSEIVRTLVECAEGVHAFVFVLKVGRYTRYEKKFLQKLQNMLTEDVLKRTVILFTFGDQLEGKDKSIDQFVQTSSELTKLVSKCANKHVIDNKLWGKKKNNVQRLRKIIYKMEKYNGVYSNELLKRVQETIQEGMKKPNNKKMSPEETQENAKENAYVTILKKVAGTAKDVLFGAFLGNSEGSNLINTISKSLEHIAGMADSAGTLGIKGAAEVALGAKLISAGVTVGAAVVGAAKAIRKPKNADSATTSNENATTLMKSAQTALENAQTNLETAITKLKKIQENVDSNRKK